MRIVSLRVRDVLLAACLVVGMHAATSVWAQAAAGQDVAVRVSKNGPAYVVDASFSVPASQDIVWAVLTDFDGMAQILSSVDASRVLNRKGNGFDVEQQSHATAGPLRISLDSVRRVQLTPMREITSVLVRGDSIQSSDFTTLVTPQGPLTRVDIHGNFVPSWLASTMVDAAKVEERVKKQYGEFRAEMLRRKNGEPTPGCIASKSCPP